MLLLLSAPTSSAQVVVNEYSCANLRQFADAYQNYEDWVELYNPGTTAVSLSNWYLSDDDDEPKKWAFPLSASIAPKGFIRIWCSGRNLSSSSNGHYHTNFRLTQTKNKPEHILLTNPSGTVVQDIVVEKTHARHSRGRLTDGGSQWRVFASPTPLSSNNGTPAYLGYTARPDVSQEGGFYTDSVTISAINNQPGSDLRYTTDGHEPDTSSTLYTGPITLRKTTVLKVAAFPKDNSLLTGFVQFNTYFINDTHSLMVVSIGSDSVIDLANGNKDLRPVGSFELFGIDQDRKARAYGDLNSHGQDSWANDQRSLDWVTRDQMGYTNAIKEKIFSQSDRDEFQRLILRAAGDDNYPAAHNPPNKGSAHVRDAYIHNLADRANLHLDVRRGEKAIVYLNGEYWGVYDLREIPDDHDYTDYYYGQGEYDIQYILTWGQTWAEYGGQTAISQWKQLYNYILNINNDLSDPAKYKYVTDRYDVKSLVDYVLVNSFTVCSDWLNYNTGWWRGLNPAGSHQKWGYILWDNDATFGHYINYTGIPNTTPDAKLCDPEGLGGWSDPEGHIKVLNRLRKNPEFNQYYLSRQADLIKTTFSCDTMLQALDQVVASIEPEMQRHAERWDGTYAEWEDNVQKMRGFIEERCAVVRSTMDDCYNLSGPFDVELRVFPEGAGTIQANSLHHQQLPVSTWYHGNMTTLLTALPDTSQYVFSHWASALHGFSPDSLAAKVSVQIKQKDVLTAVFKKKSSSVTSPHAAALQASLQVYPTLMQQDLNVSYTLPERSAVHIRLLNLLGQPVATLLRATTPQSSGEHLQRFGLQDLALPPGAYFVQVETAFGKAVQKVIAQPAPR